MTVTCVVTGLAWRLVVAAALTAWILLAACLTVTAAGFVVDAVTGGITP